MKVTTQRNAFKIRTLSMICNTRNCLCINFFGFGILVDKQPDNFFKAASRAAKVIKYHISKPLGVKLQDIIDAAWSDSFNRQ